MTNPQFNKLAGNTVADLIAYLGQFPADTRVDVLKASENRGSWDGGYSANHSSVENSDLYYSAPWDFNGNVHPGYLEIGEKS